MAVTEADKRAGTKADDQEASGSLESIHQLFEQMFLEDRKAQGVTGSAQDRSEIDQGEEQRSD